MILNGLADSLVGWLVPDLKDTVAKVIFPALLGELAILQRLLIKGAIPQGRNPGTARRALT